MSYETCCLYSYNKSWWYYWNILYISQDTSNVSLSLTQAIHYKLVVSVKYDKGVKNRLFSKGSVELGTIEVLVQYMHNVHSRTLTYYKLEFTFITFYYFPFIMFPSYFHIQSVPLVKIRTLLNWFYGWK